MSVYRLLVLLPLLAVCSSGQECNLNIQLSADQLAQVCPPQRAAQGLDEGLSEIRAENQVLSRKVESLKTEYGQMVETVARLERETASWREIIEWPVMDEIFKPDNKSVYVVAPDGPTFPDCTKAVARNSRQGIYNLQPEGASRAFLAYCDEEGWTILQRRFDGSEDFYRDWDDYMSGFGQLSGEMWLGLESVHLLTSQPGLDYQLKTEVLGYNGKLYELDNPYFLVGPEEEDYTLYIGNMTSGNFKDLFAKLDGTKFSTRDSDNDAWHNGNCANDHKGGFWLANCGFDLNRQYCDGQGCMRLAKGPAKKSIMKFRPFDGLPPAQPTRPRKPKKPRQGRGRGGERNLPYQ